MINHIPKTAGKVSFLQIDNATRLELEHDHLLITERIRELDRKIDRGIISADEDIECLEKALEENRLKKNAIEARLWKN